MLLFDLRSRECIVVDKSLGKNFQSLKRNSKLMHFFDKNVCMWCLPRSLIPFGKNLTQNVQFILKGLTLW